jgi:hypothetical protein
MPHRKKKGIGASLARGKGFIGKTLMRISVLRDCLKASLLAKVRLRSRNG